MKKGYNKEISSIKTTISPISSLKPILFLTIFNKFDHKISKNLEINPINNEVDIVEIYTI